MPLKMFSSDDTKNKDVLKHFSLLSRPKWVKYSKLNVFLGLEYFQILT